MRCRGDLRIHVFDWGDETSDLGGGRHTCDCGSVTVDRSLGQPGERIATIISGDAYLDWYDYKRAIDLDKADEPFYALVAAAMLRADTYNHERLREAFPRVRADLQARYDAPGGALDSDPDDVKIRAWGTTDNPRG